MYELTIVLDYDGTVTEQDYLDQVALVFGDGGSAACVVEELAGTVGVNEVIEREYATVRAPLDDVVAWLIDNVRVRAGFAELVELAAERSWRLVVLSSGFHEFIEPILAREGLGHLEVYANSVEAHPDGWRTSFVDQAPCSTCDAACKRRRLHQITGDEMPGKARVVYVGDGHSDLCAAEACDVIFAVAGQELEGHLTRRDIVFKPFETLTSVVESLRAS